MGQVTWSRKCLAIGPTIRNALWSLNRSTTPVVRWFILADRDWRQNDTKHFQAVVWFRRNGDGWRYETTG